MNGFIPNRLEGKVAIVTGGAIGFGESTVRLFAKHGAKVLIADVQDERGHSLCKELASKSNNDVVYVHCDVTQESDGYDSRKTWVILFTSSSASVVSGEAPHAYTASKHAVVGLMKNLCVELGRHGIRVNCISPGSVSTPFLTNAMGLEKTTVNDILCQSAVLKGVVPEVEAAVFLESDALRFVSGVNLVVDGGYSTTNPTYTRIIKQTFESLGKENIIT
ncbi:putative momilactone-A synthase [Helianthus anomalus]